MEFLNNIDLWILIGFFGQFLFFMRFFVQWLCSEKRKKSIIPIHFWYFSIAGSIVLAIYAIQRRDIVFSTGQILALFIYARNLMLIYKKRLEEKTK